MNGKLFRPLSIISVLMLFLSIFPSGVSGQPGGNHSIFIPVIMKGYGNTPITDAQSHVQVIHTPQ